MVISRRDLFSLASDQSVAASTCARMKPGKAVRLEAFTVTLLDCYLRLSLVCSGQSLCIIQKAESFVLSHFLLVMEKQEVLNMMRVSVRLSVFLFQPSGMPIIFCSASCYNCRLWPVWLYHGFPHMSWTARFSGRFFEHTYVFWFSVNSLSESSF
jgi:hypothetical protein